MDIGALLQMLTGQGGQIGGQTGSGLAYPAPLSGLQMGEQGSGATGGQSMSGAPSEGLGKAQSADSQGIDPLMLQAIMAQMQGGGGTAGAPGGSLLQGAGGGTLGQFGGGGGGGVPFGGQGPAQASMAGPVGGNPTGGGAGTAQQLAIIKAALGGISQLSRMSGGGTLGQMEGAGAGAGSLGETTPTASPTTSFGQPLLGASPLSGSLSGDATITGGLSPFGLDTLTGTQAPNLGNVGASFGAANQGMFSGGGPTGESFPVSSAVTPGEMSGVGFEGAGPNAGGFDLSGLGNWGGILGGLQGSLGLGKAIQGGDPISIAKSILGLGGNVAGMTGLTDQLNSFLNSAAGIGPTAGAAGVTGAEAAAAGGGAETAGLGAEGAGLGGIPWAAIITALITTGLSAYQRGQSGMSEGENALMSFGDLAGGAMGLNALINPMMHQMFWAHEPTAQERNLKSFGESAQNISGMLPGLHNAQTYDELATSLSPIFKSRYAGKGYAMMPGVGETDYNMGTEGMMKMPSRTEMANIFAGNDPNAIQFNWQQGIRQPEIDQMNTMLNNAVRQQAALIHGGQSGDPISLGLMQAYRQQYERDQAQRMRPEMDRYAPQPYAEV